MRSSLSFDITVTTSVTVIIRSTCILGQAISPGKLPPDSVFINPQSFDVLGPGNPNFRNSSTAQFFNPTSTDPPFFQIFDPAFLEILGTNPTFNVVSTKTSIATFAHEAPVYVPETDELFFTGADPSENTVSKLSMAAVETALRNIRGTNTTEVNVPATPLNFPDTVQRINGGTGPFRSSLLFVTDGSGSVPPSVVLVNPRPPHNATVLLDNFFGRQFNTPDDVKVHPTSGAIFFSDTSFGFLFGGKLPLLPNQVYRFDPSTEAVRVVATDFQQCNGIAFSHDGKTAYVTDTGIFTTSITTTDQTKAATIYQFDVDPRSQAFLNRRVLAYADTGIPDGIELDAAGNVYAGCGDGVNVWSPAGILLGKFFTGSTVSNLAFAGDGRVVMLALTKIYLAKIAATAGKVTFP